MHFLSEAENQDPVGFFSRHVAVISYRIIRPELCAVDECTEAEGLDLRPSLSRITVTSRESEISWPAKKKEKQQITGPK